MADLLRICVRCGMAKSPEEFYRDLTLRDGIMRKCKVCHNTQCTEYNKVHPPKKNGRASCLQCGKRFGFVVNVTLGRPRFCSRRCSTTARHVGGKYGVTEAKFRDLYLAGKSYSEIAAAFGMVHDSVIRHYINKFGLHRPEPLVDNTCLRNPYYIAKIIRMYRSGMSTDAIAKAFGQSHSHTYIRSILLDAGEQLRPRVKVSA